MSTIVKLSTIEQGLSFYKEQLDKIIDERQLVKEIGFAVQAVNSNKQLQTCSTDSIIKSIYNVALTGLSLNPVRKEAALVPKYVSGEWQAILFPMYQGLYKLVTDTGSVSAISTNLVYEGDEFDYELGLQPDIKHKPKHVSKEVRFAYSIAHLHNGQIMIEVMDKEELDYIRSCSETWKAYKSGKIPTKHVIWINYEGEMYRKTVLKRIIKYLPKTERLEQLAQAIDVDNQDYMASYEQETHILRLIENSNHDSEMKDTLERKVLAGISLMEYNNMVKELNEHQLNPITETANYNQTQLKKHLAEIAQDNRKQTNLFKDEN